MSKFYRKSEKEWKWSLLEHCCFLSFSGKILIIGGGIANFTNVATTFKGIVRALQEYQLKLAEGKVVVYVRRAGPNYQEGLRIMRELGQFWLFCFFSYWSFWGFAAFAMYLWKSSNNYFCQFYCIAQYSWCKYNLSKKLFCVAKNLLFVILFNSWRRMWLYVMRWTCLY